MNVLVTGGTGFVGSELVSELQRAGHTVHFLTRKARSGASATGRVHFGNVLRPDSLANACAGMDAVIHLAGIISEASDQTFENVHTRGTQNIVQAARRAGVKRFLQMSALGTRPNAIARYHQSKWAAEEAVCESGLDWTIFRPSIIYGPGDGFVNVFANFIRFSPIVPIIGDGTARFQPLPVEAVADAFVRALAEPKATGRTFDLCGPSILTLDEIVDRILAVMERKRIKLHLPLGIARAQAMLFEFLFGTLLQRPPPLNRDQILMLQEDNVGNGRAAEELFGLDLVPFRDGIARFLR